jgi:NAD+ synthase
MQTEQLAEKLVSWIRERVLAAGSKGVVLGLSGGLDSSVLAVLCQRAFPQSVLALIMPCHSSWEDVEQAQAIADKFSIPTKMVALEPVFDTLLDILPEDKAEPAVSRTAEANLKARLRMLTLYYFANRFNYLVVGSGNRSELSVGYFTKYIFYH